MPLPEYGKWRLKHPLFGENPPFVTLEVDLVHQTGSAAINMNWYPLEKVLARPGAGTFLCKYRVGNHHGTLEATFNGNRSLSVQFIGGTVVTSCDGDCITTAGLIQGVPDLPEAASPSDFRIQCAGDIARWFDGLVLDNEQELQRYCDRLARRHPDSWIAIGLANTGKDLYSGAAFLGQGTVDALRLGEGCYEGGWGIGKDLLRALSFLPLFGKVRPLARRISSLRGTRAAVPAAKTAAGEANAVRSAVPPARPGAPAPAPAASGPGSVGPKLPGPLARDPRGECCWAVAGVNAVQMFKGKVWISVAKLVEEVTTFHFSDFGKLIPKACMRTFLHGMKDVLRKHGVHVCELSGFKAFIDHAEKIIELAGNSRAGAVIMFSVGWITETGESVGHSLVAWKSPTGIIYLVDRTAEATGKLVRSLAELEEVVPAYKGIAGGKLMEAFQLENCVGGFLEQGGKLLFSLGVATTVAVQGLKVENRGGATASGAGR
jgi:hypothetical protein